MHNKELYNNTKDEQFYTTSLPWQLESIFEVDGGHKIEEKIAFMM